MHLIVQKYSILGRGDDSKEVSLLCMHAKKTVQSVGKDCSKRKKLKRFTILKCLHIKMVIEDYTPF